VRERLLPAAVPAVVAVGLGLAVMLWLTSSPAADLQPRVPGTDRRSARATVERPVKLTGMVVHGVAQAADIAGSWPRFRGPNFDNICRDPTPLARSWGEGGPPVLWSRQLGEGYAGAVVHKGRAYVLDYDHEAKADTLRCLSLADGQEIWHFSYPVEVKRNHGMSRTLPAVTDKHVATLGPKCHVACLDAETGQPRFPIIDLVREYGATVPPWYAGQCPLIDGERLILAPGGPDALLMAVDCNTGKVLWKTANPDRWRMTHSSVMPMEFAGKRMFVYCASGGVVGVDARDGSLLWKTPEWRISIANVPSPVPLGNGRIFLTGGYNAGSMILQLEEKDGKFEARPLLRLKAKVFDSPQHTPILYQGHLYAVCADGQLACATPDGKVVWKSGAAHRFGLGPYLVSDQGLLYVMNDTGTLTLAEASPAGFKVLAQARVLDGRESWAPMTLVAGRLIVRDTERMVCLDVGKH